MRPEKATVGSARFWELGPLFFVFVFSLTKMILKGISEKKEHFWWTPKKDIQKHLLKSSGFPTKPGFNVPITTCKNLGLDALHSFCQAHWATFDLPFGPQLLKGRLNNSNQNACHVIVGPCASFTACPSAKAIEHPKE